MSLPGGESAGKQDGRPLVSIVAPAFNEAGIVHTNLTRLAEFMETLQYEATPDQPVVTYCKGPSCDLSHQLATELRKHSSICRHRAHLTP